MKRPLFFAALLLTSLAPLHSQIESGPTLPAFEAVMSDAKSAEIDGHKTIRVTKDPAVTKDDEPTYARLTGSNFQNGIIEAKVFSRLLTNAPDHARGFIGIAFRIDDSNSKFECIYLRPTNGRADDQIRRNRAIQYFSFPEYKFDRTRRETPAKYETYADMGLGEWIEMKIVVEGSKAALFLNKGNQPALIVNDLKHGADAKGAIGLWVDIGTEGFFRDVKITSR
ncbi:MAG: hypothetical protein EOP84_09370 [Verrucomicrobiaceae bacterium]|nr:MAG: hypothetical protein EOP84_09370 [Verrucomicrobiaceae bacterium]